MQTNNISNYLQQIMHENTSKVVNANNTKNAVNNINTKSNTINKTSLNGKDFDKMFNTITSGIKQSQNTDNSYIYNNGTMSKKEIAQEAYADLLKMQVMAITGEAVTDNSTTSMMSNSSKTMGDLADTLSNNSVTSKDTSKTNRYSRSSAISNYRANMKPQR